MSEGEELKEEKEFIINYFRKNLELAHIQSYRERPERVKTLEKHVNLLIDEARREALKKNIKTLKYLHKVLDRDTRCGYDCALVERVITEEIDKLKEELEKELKNK